MSNKHSEKIMKDLNKFLEQHADENMNEAQMDRLVKEFIEHHNNNLPVNMSVEEAETADDYLELAENAEDEAQALKYAKKAFSLDPDNLDAERMIAEISANGPMELLNRMGKIVAHGASLMEKTGLFEESYVGDFWGIIETRPYMRTLEAHAILLKGCGMMRRAIQECEEMIRLNENDNQGMRYTLMHLYAFLEMEEEALALHKRYDAHEETQMLLPLSVLYFKKQDLEQAGKYLKRLAKVNKDTKKFFKAIIKDDLDRYVDEMDQYGYRPFTIEELIVDLMENEFLLQTTPMYFMWAYEHLQSKK